MFLTGAIIGLVLGTIFGFVTCALVTAGSDSDDASAAYRLGFDNGVKAGKGEL